MSNPLAHYSFLPWLRRGIGTMISESDGLGAEPAGAMKKERAEMEVGLAVETTAIADGAKVTSEVNKTFKFLGPPDVLAISEKAIVRTEPKPGVNNFESNGLPYIEFYEEDFLWQYTPAGAVTEKLSPWLALICLKNDEFELKNTSEGRPYITITESKIGEVFHPEDQNWAWAHVHLNTELTAATLNGQMTEVSSELRADPDSGVSRLICPRKLVKEMDYTAFVIPAYETGRLAVLGASYENVYAQKMSWKHGDNYAGKTRGFDFPVYYSWKFRTGLHGDFESLARLLEPVVSNPELGKRAMYIADAGYGSESITPESSVLGMEGALKPPGFVPDPWTDGPGDEAYKELLRKLLNLSIDTDNRTTGLPVGETLTDNPFYSASLGDDPIVTPQVYGRWHGLVTRLQNTSSNYEWVNTLNLDPRNRATAGLGTSVVQKNQEQYMRRAWKQVEQINEANKKIRKAALARMINYAIHYKHIRPASTDHTVRLTSALHSFVRHDDGVNPPQTIFQTISKSVVPNASQSAAFKKVTRPGKGLNKKVNREIQRRIDLGSPGLSLLHQRVTENFNQDAIKAAPEKISPALAIDTVQIETAINATIATFTASDNATATEAVFQALSAETNFNNLHQAARKTALKARINSTTISAAAKTLARNLVDGIISSVDGGTEHSHKIRVNTPPFTAIFANTPATSTVTAKVYNNIVIDIDTNGAPGVISRATTLADIQVFSDTLGEFKTYAAGNTIDLGILPLSNVDALRSTLAEKLDQKKLMVSRFAGSITLNVFNPGTHTYIRQQLDQLKPVMAHPKFEDPMFRELKAISQEYILPNLSMVKENTITLLETNQAFIEAYMAGLNHEMSRELLWREYPTDQRGTYFRQFWDVADNTTHSGEERLDIKTMDDWKAQLGDHSPRAVTNSKGTYLVLLVRGELLKKYPNTQVYAQKAAFENVTSPSTPRVLADETVSANIQTPVFMAELDPDIYLFGFDLDEETARGDTDDPAKPGWFFVLRERPGQIRFGLDDWTPIDTEPELPDSDPQHWNDLSWEHFVSDKSELDSYQLDATHSFGSSAGSENSPRPVWGKNSADIASILYQNPVLFARHASEMLPDEPII